MSWKWYVEHNVQAAHFLLQYNAFIVYKLLFIGLIMMFLVNKFNALFLKMRRCCLVISIVIRRVIQTHVILSSFVVHTLPKFLGRELSNFLMSKEQSRKQLFANS